jgi:TRAP transporter TAXI family solute receptor
MLTREEIMTIAPPRALGAAALGFVAMAVGATLASAQTYGVATMQPGTLNYTSGSAIAKVMQQQLGMQTRVQPSGGESTLLPLVNAGEADLGIANIAEVVDAYEGRARAGKQEKLRVVAAIYPIRVAFFVRKDSDIKSVADLKGRRVPLGFSAMGTIDAIVRAKLAGAGLTEKDVKPVLVPNVLRSADDFLSGAADAFEFALGAGKVNEVDASVGGIRAISVSDTPQALDAMKKIFPYVYITTVSPRTGLTAVSEPTKVFSYDNLLVTSADAKDDAVYKILDGLIKNKGELVGTAPWLAEFVPATAYKKYRVPYHPGAMKWYADNKVEMKE